MPNIRSMTEDELYELVEKCTSQPAGGTAQAQQEKQLHLGLTELTLRSQKATREHNLSKLSKLNNRGCSACSGYSSFRMSNP